MKIFISIASYRDSELPKTVQSLYDNADHPENLVFGIVNQDQRGKHADFSWLGDQVRLVNMHFKDAKGAGYARKLAMELYDGEDFFFQTDSHMRFARSWDTTLLNMYDWCVNDAGTHKVILSQYAAPYKVLTDGTDHYIKDDPAFWDEPSWTSVVNTWAGVWAGNREVIPDLSHPYPSHTVLGALLFCHGDIVDEVPYDERISFMGEELCFAARAWTRGWKIYAPNEMVAWHFYKREDHPKIWADNKAGRTWTEIEHESFKVQERILKGEETGIYGIDDIDKFNEYQKMVGLHFASFYDGEIHLKINLSTVTQEMEFDDNFDLIEIRKTGYCAKNMHTKCLFEEACECACHGEEK